MYKKYHTSLMFGCVNPPAEETRRQDYPQALNPAGIQVTDMDWVPE